MAIGPGWRPGSGAKRRRRGPAAALRGPGDPVLHAAAEPQDHPEDQEVVVDGNIITSRTPKDLPAFCTAIIEALTEVEVAA